MAYKYIETRDKLYAKAYRVHSGTIPTTINIKTRYPDIDYTKLTSADFVASYKSDSSQSKSAYSAEGNPDTYYVNANSLTVNCSYNASTGVLSVTNSTNSAFSYYIGTNSGSNSWSGLTGEVIMIVDGIRSEYT